MISFTRTLVACVLAALAVPALAQPPAAGTEHQAGQISFPEFESWWISGGKRSAAAVGGRVDFADELETGRATGRVTMLYLPEFRTTSRHQVTLLQDTHVRVDFDEDSKISIFKIRDGGVRFDEDPGAQKGDLVVQAGDARLTPDGTSFAVFYYPETGVAEIVVMTGTVEVRNVHGRETVLVGAMQQTRVEPGWPPTIPAAVSPQEAQQIDAQFAFVGGGWEQSQTVDNPLLTGVEVPQPDRAPDSGSDGLPRNWRARSEEPATLFQPARPDRSVDLLVGF